MKNIKKIICSIVCFALLLGTAAFADEEIPTTDGDNQESIVTITSGSLENAANDDTADEALTEPAKEETKDENVSPETAETTESTETTGTTDADTPAAEEKDNETSTEENPSDVKTENPAPIGNDEIKVSVNGQMVIFDDVKPQILDGRTFVPFRKVGDAMNAAVAWRGTDRTAHYFRNGISVMLTIGKSEMEVREYEIGEKFVYTTEAKVSTIDPDQPSVIARTIDDRTMIPIRATAEALGAKVDWDDATRTVIITIPAYSLKLADKDAAALVENWNYKPATELKTGSVEIKVYGDFEGAEATLGDGVSVTLDGKTQTTANGGIASFSAVKAGSYKLTVSDIPEGYAVSEDVSYDVTVVAGETVSVSVSLVKEEKNAESETDTETKDTDESGENTDENTENKTEDKVDDKADDKANEKTEEETK